VIRQRMEAAYDHVAAQYAEQNAIMPQILVKLATRFLARLEPGAHILDAGCGDGRHMAWMEEQGLHVTGKTASLARRRGRAVSPYYNTG
jgi:cyclopropane fatty-acyl-phospholipid synthase-like methyltransferase